MLYKKPGRPNYVTVPRKELLTCEYVSAQLRLAGASDADIKTFIDANSQQREKGLAQNSSRQLERPGNDPGARG